MPEDLGPLRRRDRCAARGRRDRGRGDVVPIVAGGVAGVLRDLRVEPVLGRAGAPHVGSRRRARRADRAQARRPHLLPRQGRLLRDRRRAAVLSGRRPGAGAGDMSFTVAIDGPAASGKGTIARAIAARYGLEYLDTGLLYRAVGRAVLDGALPEEAARALRAEDLRRDGLRTGDVGAAASKVASVPEVRAALLDFQKAFARRAGGAVLDGRDIGTVICPEAEVKLFVTASDTVRARRRWGELSRRSASTSSTLISSPASESSPQRRLARTVSDAVTKSFTSASGQITVPMSRPSSTAPPARRAKAFWKSRSAARTSGTDATLLAAAPTSPVLSPSRRRSSALSARAASSGSAPSSTARPTAR